VVKRVNVVPPRPAAADRIEYVPASHDARGNAACTVRRAWRCRSHGVLDACR